MKLSVATTTLLIICLARTNVEPNLKPHGGSCEISGRALGALGSCCQQRRAAAEGVESQPRLGSGRGEVEII